MTLILQQRDFAIANASRRNAARLASSLTTQRRLDALRDAQDAYADHVRETCEGTRGEYGALCIGHDLDQAQAIAKDIVALSRKISQRLASFRFGDHPVDTNRLAILMVEALEIAAPVYSVIDAAVRAELG